MNRALGVREPKTLGVIRASFVHVSIYLFARALGFVIRNDSHSH